MDDNNTITDDNIFSQFIKLYPKTKTKKTVLTQKEIKKFYKVWESEFISYRGKTRIKKTDTKKEKEYKNCLFTIYSRHWEEVDGFQISMERTSKLIGKSVPTVSRMITVFLKTGILIRCHNYCPGKQSFFYHKNSELFNYLFKSSSNDYYEWLFNNKNNVTNNIINTSNVITNKKPKTTTVTNKRGRKPRTYVPNFDLLLKIEKEFLPIVYRLNKGQHINLQIEFGLSFNDRGNYTGRSHSLFCLTLNENKKYSSDNSMTPRSLFLTKMGLSNYRQVYDIKSEVPRTTVLCNTGIWKPDSWDFYREVIKNSQPIEVSRDRLKELYMRFNFDIGTDKELFNHFRRSRILTIGKEYGLDFSKSSNSKYKINYNKSKNIYEKKLENNEEFNFNEWLVLKEVINNTQGKSWGNLIFWWTSLIQIKTIYTVLKETGIRIYNVYDGFYCPKEITKVYLVDVVKRSSEYIYKKYIKKMNSPY